MKSTEKSKIEKGKRKNGFAKLEQFCTFAMSEPTKNSFVEVTEWANKEGFDARIVTASRSENFKMTHGEFKALKTIIKELNI